MFTCAWTQSKREELVLLGVMLISVLLHSCQSALPAVWRSMMNQEDLFVYLLTSQVPAKLRDMIAELKSFNVLKKTLLHTFLNQFICKHSLIKTIEHKCFKSKEACRQNVPLMQKCCLFPEGCQKICVKLTELLHSDYISHNVL